MNQFDAGSLSRRGFVAGAGAMALGGTWLARAGEKGLGGAGAPLAVFSKIYQELKLDFEQSADVTAQAGLDGIDCTVRPGGEIAPDRAVELMPRYARALERRHMKMLLLTTGITSPASDHAREILRAGKELGVRYYRVGTWPHRRDVPAEKLVEKVLADLKGLAALNRELGVCAVIQNHSAPGYHERRPAGCDLGEMLQLVRDFDPEQIAVAFDLSHAIIEHGDQWVEYFEKLRKHIRVIYIKDVQRPSKFVRYGDGEFSQSDFFRRFAQMEYDAPISVHVEYEWATREEKTARRLAEELKNCVRMTKKWLGVKPN